MLLAPRLATSVILLSVADGLSRGFRHAPPIKVQEEMGISPTLSILSFGYFDPLRIADDENFSVLREAELKHGRISMMATLGMACSDKDIIEAFISGDLPFNTAKPAIHELTPSGVAGMLILCAILETQVLVQRDPQDMPGDYGLGYFGRRDKARHERSLICELENGRLAMIIFTVQVMYELIFQKNCWYLLLDRIHIPDIDFVDLILQSSRTFFTNNQPI